MLEPYFFDLPIYRLTEEAYDREVDEAVEAHLRYVESGRIKRETLPDFFKKCDIDFRTKRGPWDFNQVVGWLRLFGRGSSIAGHVYFTRARRIQWNSQKHVVGLSTPSSALASYVEQGWNDRQIYDHVLECLKDFASEGWMKRRHLDLSTFKNIGPFVRWRALLNDGAKRSH